MKALFIDVIKRTVTEIEIADWREIAPKLDCRTFACPLTFDNEDTVYVDDEGLLVPFTGAFLIEGAPQPYMGNGILLGGNDEGGSEDVKTTADKLREKITFMDLRELRRYIG